jgi:hypothetical protein
LQDVATNATRMAVPALFVEPDVKRPVRLAAMVRAIAEDRLPRLLCDAATQHFAGDLADIHIGNLPVVRVDIYRRRGHGRDS